MRLLVQLRLYLGQGQIALLPDPADHLTLDLGSNLPLAARVMPHSLGLTAVLASRRDFPSPSHAHSKTRGQLRDRTLATIQRGKKFAPQIIIVRLCHTLFVTEFARTATIHYLAKCSNIQIQLNNPGLLW